MKKVFFAFMAMVAICFAACTNKTQAPANTEGPDVEAAVTETTSALSEQIEAQDVDKFKSVVSSITDKIKELIKADPEAAKEYVAKVQDFLKQNADKIKSFVGDNESVNGAINSLVSTPADKIVSGITSIMEGVDKTTEAAKDAASEAAADAKDAASKATEDAKDAAKDKANEVKDAVKQKTSDAIDKAADKVKSGLGVK